MAKQRSNPKQRAFYEFLLRMGQFDLSFTAEEIADNTGYPLKGTVKAKISRDEWQRVLERLGPNEFKAKDILQLTYEEFVQRLSVKGLHVERPNTALHDRLYQKAQDNITLALELYNRPSLLNRLDAFAMLFCAAWENLLKGEVGLSLFSFLQFTRPKDELNTEQGQGSPFHHMERIAFRHIETLCFGQYKIVDGVEYRGRGTIECHGR